MSGDYLELLDGMRNRAEGQGYDEIARRAQELSDALQDAPISQEKRDAALATLSELYVTATLEDRMALEDAALRLAALTASTTPPVIPTAARLQAENAPLVPKKIEGDMVTVTPHGAVLVKAKTGEGKEQYVALRIPPWTATDLIGKDVALMVGAGGRLRIGKGLPDSELEFLGYLRRFIAGREADILLFDGEAGRATRIVTLSYRGGEWGLKRETLARHYPSGANVPDLHAEALELEAPFPALGDGGLWRFHEIKKGSEFSFGNWRLLHLGRDKWRIFIGGEYLGDIDLDNYPPPTVEPIQFMQDVISAPGQMKTRRDALVRNEPMVVPLGSGSGFTSESASSHMFIDANGEITIVDPNIQVLDALKRLGVPLDRVRRVIVSHVHYDHVAGLWLLARYLPRRAELLIHSNPGDEAEIAAGKTGEGEISTLKAIVAMAEEASDGELRGAELLKFFSIRPMKLGRWERVGDFTMQFFHGKHTVPAIGYQIVNRGTGRPVFLFSGDTKLGQKEREGFLAGLIAASLVAGAIVYADAGVAPLHPTVGFYTQLLGALESMGFGGGALSEMRHRMRLYHAARAQVEAAGFRYAGFGWGDAVPLARALEWEPPRPEDVYARMIQRALLNIPVLSALRATDLSELAGMGTLTSFTRGNVLMHEGGPADEMFLILDGAVSITRAAETGNDVILRTATSGLLGEAVFAGQKIRNATVTALTDVAALRFGTDEITFLQRIGVAARLIHLRDLREKIMEAGGRVHVMTRLDEGTRDAVLLKAQIAFYRPGQIVIEEDGPPDGVFIVVDGEVKVSARSGPLAKTSVKLGRDSVIGEGTALGGKRRSATVRATTDTQLLHVTGDDVRELMKERSDLRGYLMGLAQDRGSIRHEPEPDPTGGEEHVEDIPDDTATSADIAAAALAPTTIGVPG